MSENKKPTGPTPPDGYRWVPKGQIVWPSDVCRGVGSLHPSLIRADVIGDEWRAATCEFFYMRPKVTQPDLVWLKSKASKYAESLTGNERENVRWQIAQAVQLYAETLMKLIPDQTQKGGAE